MLETDKETVGRIVPGKLSVCLKGYPDLFGDDGDKVKSLTEALEKARHEQNRLKHEHILEAFRNVVKEFTEFSGNAPTKVYMSSIDVFYLYSEYNNETRNLNLDRAIVNEYNNDTLLVDGIIIKKGCDRENGQMTIHGFE